MNEEILHLIAGRVLSVSLERLGYEILTHDELVSTASSASAALMSKSPEAKLALESEGSDLLKAFLICKCIASIPGDPKERSELEIRIAACAASSAVFFLESVEKEVENETDRVRKAADVLLLSIANEFFGSN